MINDRGTTILAVECELEWLPIDFHKLRRVRYIKEHKSNQNAHPVRRSISDKMRNHRL